MAVAQTETTDQRHGVAVLMNMDGIAHLESH
jgi:hypothetical protein